MPKSAVRTPIGPRPGKRAVKTLRLAEDVLLTVGLFLIVLVAGAYIHREVMFRAAMKSFDQARREATKAGSQNKGPAPTESSDESAPAVDENGPAIPDGRASATARSLRSTATIPLAILRIPKIHLEVPVLGATDDITLNQGVGQIAGTASPGEKGNIGIAGHRDGFFRNLKDLSRGDVIELETTTASELYVVDSVLVTGPDDTSVLRPREAQSLTLVTCYPFNFVGPAPRRFIVEASLKK
jgi:sortase A